MALEAATGEPPMPHPPAAVSMREIGDQQPTNAESDSVAKLAARGIVLAPGLTNDMPPVLVQYKRAKEALAKCGRLDEAKAFVDKLVAMEAYARQAKDEELERDARRVRLMAWRRVGELLQTFNQQGCRTDKLSEGAHGKLTQREAAERAGLSESQELTAVRIANVPEDAFQALLESEEPPSVTTMAGLGKLRKAVVPENGSSPMDEPDDPSPHDEPDDEDITSATENDDPPRRTHNYLKCLNQALQAGRRLLATPESLSSSGALVLAKHDQLCQMFAEIAAHCQGREAAG